MKFPEDIKKLSLEEAQKTSIVAEARIAELKELRDEAKDMESMLAAREELKELTAKKAELDALITEVTKVEDEPEEVVVEEEVVADEAATEEDKVEEEVVAEETQEVATDSEEGSTEPVAEEEVKEETVAEVADITPEATSEVEIKTPEAIAASLEGENKVDVDINEPSESTVAKGHLAASFVGVVDGAKDELDAISRVQKRPQGGEAFKTVFSGESVVKTEDMNANQMTDFVMSLGTPGREDEFTRGQKQWALAKGDVAASLCQPPQIIDSDTACGSYDPVIFNSLPNFVMDGLEIEVFVPVDPSDADFVGEVALTDSSGDPLDSIEEKACYELECVTRNRFEPQEVKACLTANEQTAFTAPRAVQGLLSDGTALLAATRDQLLLEAMIDQTYKFGYTCTTGGYAEIALATAIVVESLDRQSKITQVNDLVPYIPKSLLNYAVVDNAARQFSLADAQAAADGLFHGIGTRSPIVYDDALDSTNLAAVDSLSKTSSTTITAASARDDWTIHLINPAEAFVGLRNENEYSLSPVPQGIDDKRNNQLSWFARNYFTFGRRGCDGWASISISNLCLGGRVVAAASCLGV